MGHENVQVLDGGFPKWVGEDKPTEGLGDNIGADDFSYDLQPEKLRFLK